VENDKPWLTKIDNKAFKELIALNKVVMCANSYCSQVKLV